MKIRNLLCVVLLLSASACKKSLQQYFQSSLSTVSAFEKPDPTSKILASFDHNAAIEVVLDPGTKSPLIFASENGTMNFAEIRLKAGTRAFISSLKLSEIKTNYYFRIVSTDGLNLRSEPNPRSKILSVLPFNHVGEIKRQVGEYTHIQERHGYWSEVSYGNLTGYIFSGFVKIAGNKNDLEESFLNYEFTELPERSFDFTEKKGKVQKKDTFKNFEIYEVAYPVTDSDCEAKQSVIVFKHLLTQKTYVSDTFYSERISGVDKIFPNAYNTWYSVCHCCCGGAGDNTFFFTKSKVYVVHTTFQPQELSCSWGNFDGPGYGIFKDLRKDEAGNIFVHLRLPDCMDTGNEDFKSGRIKVLKNVKTISATSFIKISADDSDFSTQIFKNADIPPEYKAKWDQFTKLKLN